MYYSYHDMLMQSLKTAVSDIGKPILPEHLLLVADCLSVTGEFIGLNAKGIEKQRDLASVSSPFTQACFSVSFLMFLLSFLNEYTESTYVR